MKWPENMEASYPVRCKIATGTEVLQENKILEHPLYISLFFWSYRQSFNAQWHIPPAKQFAAFLKILYTAKVLSLCVNKGCESSTLELLFSNRYNCVNKESWDRSWSLFKTCTIWWGVIDAQNSNAHCSYSFLNSKPMCALLSFRLPNSLHWPCNANQVHILSNISYMWSIGWQLDSKYHFHFLGTCHISYVTYR